MSSTGIPQSGPPEIPSWHLEFPLRWPGIIFAKPDSVRFHPASLRAAIPMKKRVPVFPTDSLESRIVTLRGQKVILDSDLADLYGVETSALNRAVKRNTHRFPADFVFQLTREEFENLRCQIGISSSRYGGRRFLPYAFTENGAVMAANLLNSEQAVRMSVFVVRAFIQMRELLSGSRALASELKKLEAKLTSRLDVHEVAITEILRRIMACSIHRPGHPGRRNRWASTPR